MIEYCVNCGVNRASLCAECEQYDLDHIAALQAKLAQKQAMIVQLSRQVAALEAELATERKRLAIARERAMAAWRRARGVWDNWPPLTVKQLRPISKRWDRRIAELTDIQRRKDAIV